MNFLHATVEANVLHTMLGDIPLEAALRQTLERQNAPRDLIVGLRPEAFEDAALVEPGRRGMTFSATVDVMESLGSDVYAYFREEGWQPAAASELTELAADSGVQETGADQDQIVTRLSAATRIREGSRAEMWVDTAKIQVFDPRTGANLTHPENNRT
jgi:multiple sugar transport system ATP-binding protein